MRSQNVTIWTNATKCIFILYKDTFCLAICPNDGSYDQGWTRIELILCASPPKLTGIDLNWRINLEATESSSFGGKTCYVDSGELNHRFVGDSCAKRWGSNTLSFDNFQELNGLTIYAEITNNTDTEKEHDISKWDRFVHSRQWKGKTLRDVIIHNHEYYEHRFDLLDEKLKSMTVNLQKISQQMLAIRQSQQNKDKEPQKQLHRLHYSRYKT